MDSQFPPKFDPAHRDERALNVDHHVRDLSGEPDRAEDVAERRIQFFRRVWYAQEMGLSDLEPYRIRVAWRWVREIATLKSLVADDEPLQSALLEYEEGSNPWADGDAGSIPAGSGYLRLRADVVDAANAPDGLPLLPPRVHQMYLNERGEVEDGYKPASDPSLCRWMDFFNRVCRYLGVIRGSVDNPDDGRWGLLGLTDENSVRRMFPSPFQIITWENVLIKDTWEGLTNGGQRRAEQELAERYGLNDHETLRLIKMAGEYGRLRNTDDIEVSRAMQIARLEDLILRCQRAPVDVRAELQAHKELNTLKGLKVDRGDDFLEDAARIMYSEAKKTLAPPSSPRSLTEG